MLVESRHGSLVNLRPEEVSHEFVNSVLNHAKRRQFTVDRSNWDEAIPSAKDLGDYLIAFLSDIGTSLDLSLYEEALIHFLGGESVVLGASAVTFDGAVLGSQMFRQSAEGVAFKITCFEEVDGPFRGHAERLLQHTELQALQWINIGRQRITFTTLRNPR